MKDSLPKRAEKNVVLSDKGIDEEGPSQSTPGVTSNKSHQISETNKHHDINILEGRISLWLQFCGWIEVYSHKDPYKSDNYYLNDEHGKSECV